MYAILEERTLDFYASKKHFIDHDQALNNEGVSMSFYKISDLSVNPSAFGYGLDMEDEEDRASLGLRSNLKKLSVFLLPLSSSLFFFFSFFLILFLCFSFV